MKFNITKRSYASVIYEDEKASNIVSELNLPAKFNYKTIVLPEGDCSVVLVILETNSLDDLMRFKSVVKHDILISDATFPEDRKYYDYTLEIDD